MSRQRATATAEVHALPHGITREAVREQAARILASANFADSSRMIRFLQFAVDETLEGRADRLKEIVIGMEVFDRSPSYDPRLDPIVRVEARRLRARRNCARITKVRARRRPHHS